MKILFSVSQLHSQAVHQPDCHVWLFGGSDRILLPPLETYAQYSMSASWAVSAGLCAGLSLEDNWEAQQGHQENASADHKSQSTTGQLGFCIHKHL